MKLAIVSALLLGACVAADTDDVAKVGSDNVAPINVIDEVEIPTATPDHVDYGSVIITGVEIPGRQSTKTHLDWQTVLEVDPYGWSMEFCAASDSLPASDVCSAICDPDSFIARVNDTNQQNPETCTQHSCQLGDKIVNIEVCSPANS